MQANALRGTRIQKYSCGNADALSPLKIQGCVFLVEAGISPRHYHPVFLSWSLLLPVFVLYQQTQLFSPVTFTDALVVNLFNNASSKEPSVATTCRLLFVLPSFNAINWLFRNVRTQPITVTSCPASPVVRSCLIFVRLLNMVACFVYSDTVDLVWSLELEVWSNLPVTHSRLNFRVAKITNPNIYPVLTPILR
jgi:hypothetical protein